MQFITGKISEISRGALKAKPKSKVYKMMIGETEITLGWLAPSPKKISVGDKITAMLEKNPKDPEGPPICVAFRNWSRNLDIPSHTDVIMYWIAGGLSIVVGTIAFLFSPYTASSGGLTITVGIVSVSCGFKFRRITNLLDAEIARQESQDQEKV
jgi:hypothetical protein